MPIYWPSYFDRVLVKSERSIRWLCVSDYRDLAGQEFAEASGEDRKPSRPVVQSWLESMLREGKLVCLLGQGGRSFFSSWGMFKADFLAHFRDQLRAPHQIIEENVRTYIRTCSHLPLPGRITEQTTLFNKRVASRIFEVLITPPESISFPSPFNDRRRKDPANPGSIEEEPIDPVTNFGCDLFETLFQSEQ